MQISKINSLSTSANLSQYNIKKDNDNNSYNSASSLYNQKGLSLAFSGHIPIKTCLNMLISAKNIKGERKFNYESVGAILDQLESYETKLQVKPMIERLLNMGTEEIKLNATDIKLFFKYTNGKKPEEQKAVLRLFEHHLNNEKEGDFLIREGFYYIDSFLKYFKNTDTIYEGIGGMEKSLPENSEKSKLMYEIFSMFCPQGEARYSYNSNKRVGSKAKFMTDYAQMLTIGQKIGKEENAKELVHLLNDSWSTETIKNLLPHINEKTIADTSWLNLNKPQMERHFGMKKGELSPIPTDTRRATSERRYKTDN